MAQWSETLETLVRTQVQLPAPVVVMVTPAPRDLLPILGTCTHMHIPTQDHFLQTCTYFKIE